VHKGNHRWASSEAEDAYAKEGHEKLGLCGRVWKAYGHNTAMAASERGSVPPQ